MRLWEGTDIRALRLCFEPDLWFCFSVVVVFDDLVSLLGLVFLPIFCFLFSAFFSASWED